MTTLNKRISVPKFVCDYCQKEIDPLFETVFLFVVPNWKMLKPRDIGKADKHLCEKCIATIAGEWFDHQMNKIQQDERLK